MKIYLKVAIRSPSHLIWCYELWLSPKISHTEVSDKMAYANSVDPDQTAP